MECPKCQGAMETVEYQGVEVDRCTRCGGMWFDLGEQTQLKATPGSEAIDTGDPAVGQAQDEIGDYKCPRCGSSMIKMVDIEQPHLWYEQCYRCGGVYFDAGEFKDFKHYSLGDLVHRWHHRSRM